MSDQTYAFQNALHAQRERLRALEAVFDPGTLRCLEERGVGPGWRCLEVGAGGGSVARWLVSRVAPDGSVLATDLDVTHLHGLEESRLEVRAHNLLVDELPQAEFDLVHLRLVLSWLPEPAEGLRRLIGALKPGGLLVAEDIDFVSAVPDPRVEPSAAALFARALGAHNDVLSAQHRFDPFHGRRVAGDLADAGLADLGCDARATIWRGGEAGGRIWRLTLTQLREPMIASGALTPAEADAAIALCDDPRLSFLSPLIMAAWGRRPPAQPAAG
jgi:SAM-dependent methyltransferase